eukprot:TRINITY_DN537_c0_g1_i1.p1 TRINITY_DN537_c0_g1~~TRINITY_DN537_c0_g1_i1.p1  ORF type:complete len:1090 (-),score=255.81 TRINITY_DN537_c0_g1_i1:3521-6790(-)
MQSKSKSQSPFGRFRSVLLLSIVFGLRSAVAAEPINFNRDIRPILSDRCFACHGPDKNARKADLRLDQRHSAVETDAIKPGNPEGSELVRRIFSNDEELLMPPAKHNKPLTAEQKELLKRWIADGAEYQPHWAFIPVPKEVHVPKPADPGHWIRQPIDAFVLNRLQQLQLEPSVEATREKWLRRATFDLTGLPPTVAELDAFQADQSPEAYERVVDRQLESPAFGERMANEWLDVARYADTFGYQADRDMHVWPWREWVIRAFNQNLPYDQFITWQTAGDLLPNPTRDQRLATTFNRLHRQTNEGGSIEAEFRIAYVADRVVTNGTAFLGLTFECARCHDHKFDPITQRDFYQFAAFFSNIDEHGLYSHFTETAPTPALLLYDGDQEVKHRELLDKIRLKEAELTRIREEAKERFANHAASKPDYVVTSPHYGAVAHSPKAAEAASQVISATAKFSFEDANPGGGNALVTGVARSVATETPAAETNATAAAVASKAIQFDGDDSFACKGSGQFGRISPFTFSLWVHPASHKPREVILHQSVAAEDAAFRGISLVLDDGEPVVSLIHFWPGNAIQVSSPRVVPIGQWTLITVTYDGSSHASGLQIYLNGQRVELDVARDKLTRDIKYRAEWGDSNSGGVELALGARFRDVGFKGGAVDELLVFNQELTPLEVAALLGQYTPPHGLQPPQGGSDQTARFEHYLRRHDQAYQTAATELQTLRNEENEFVTKVRQIMTMQEMNEPRPVFVLKRGAYDSPAEQVGADTPAGIFPLAADLPGNRLGLAKWMTDDRNPLVSRVAVNRFWGYLFGRGLVASVEDFGAQGQSPTHPELLDWLARDFMNSGWNVKRFCKQIVLSATYRQSSTPKDPQVVHSDPDNLWLARGTRYRLPAEQIRDNALAVSGLLVSKLGGPSVMPYQPAGLWEEAGTGKSYNQAKGEGLYRRSIYTFWRRTSPPPTMVTFDATGRETCTARRERTATPLQALVLLNDPQYIEAARVLAEKLILQNPESVDVRLNAAFRLLTSRTPSEKEMAVLRKLYEEQKSHFTAAPAKATELITIGDSPRNEKIDSVDHAAMTVVVQTLMNFDECVTKR